MKRMLSTAVLVTANLLVQAQTASTLIGKNNVEARINARAALFWDGNNSYFRVPKTGIKSTIFASSPWIGGMSNGQLYLMAETYRQAGKDNHQGPVAAAYTTDFAAYWDRVWKVSATDIQAFRDTLAQGGTPNPILFRDILEWPATGNVYGDDTTTAYAPFVDVNNDQTYTPLSGDYPLIKGDIATFSIFNDDLTHTETGSEPLKVEIHRMVYEYEGTEAIDHTLFVNYRIINRSDRTYDSLIVANWTDFDLGQYDDDYVGTDTALHCVFAYNGDSLDQGAMGYGITPPAEACVILNHPIWASMYYVNDLSPISGNPISPDHYYNYMKGLWLNGTPKSAADSGYNTNGPETRFSYGGDPCSNSGWWEGNAGIAPGDRRILACIPPQTFAPGQSIELDLAYVYSRASSGDQIASVCKLKEDVTAIRNFYSMPTHTPQAVPSELVFALFPNPANTLITVHLQTHRAGTITVSDLTGKTVLQMPTNGHPETSIQKLPAGMYLVTVQTEIGSATQKLLVTD